MPLLEHIGTDAENARELYVIDVTSPDHIPDVINFAGRFATFLLVWNSSETPFPVICHLARKLIDAGGVYFCTWGAGCERLHDLIDEEWVGDGTTPQPDNTLMTTWHDSDSLADAIWFAMYNAFPTGAYIDGCRSVVAICIDCPDFATEVRVAFDDPVTFNARIHNGG
tara:strand:+ start:179 stop:682 length:504 start_codon:yes stop_codon:yes gene_type:complete